MNRKVVIIDWNSQIVSEWFNSDSPGGFIREVTNRNLYRKYDEIGVICVTRESAFKKKILMGNVLTWIKRRINNLRSTIEGDVNVYVFRGCTPDYNFALSAGIPEYSKTLKDEDSLILFGKRVRQRFVNVSGEFIFAEEFFNEYFDELFDKISGMMDKYHFFQSDYLTFDQIKETADGFFKLEKPIVMSGREIERDFIRVQDSNDYFSGLFTIDGIPFSDNPEVPEMALNELVDFFKATI